MLNKIIFRMLDQIIQDISDLKKMIISSSSIDINKYNYEISLLKKKYLSKKDGLFILYKKEIIQSKNIDQIKKIKDLENQVSILFDDLVAEYNRKNAQLNIDSVDLNLNIPMINQGSISPLRMAKVEILSIMSRFGFDHVEDRIIEDDYHNFTALNIPENHPARDMHDTFYLKNKKLLRTHTSTVQIRYMSNNKPPFSFVSSGSVFRYENMDSTHSPMFNQIEGVLLNEEVSFAQLKSFLTLFLRQFFNDDTLKVRFRPSYFPFTQPSAEVDIFKNNKWLEVLGCGMIHNNVLKNLDIDVNKYSGFAFGMGIDRLAMLKYGINNIRNLYSGSFEWAVQNNFKV